MRTPPLLALALALLTVLSPVAAAPIMGTASVVDGDTLRIRGTSIRLHGIDAPESDQHCTREDGRAWRCGQQAALALDDHIGRRTVSCEERDTDRYGRVVAECFVGGASLNRWMVRNGWAVAYRSFSTAYVPDERQAKAERLHIWSGTFVMPADHRRTGRARQAPSNAAMPPPNADCLVKGNVSSSGERIFHVPGQRDYERVVINERAGERWFCSPAEAAGAGWRPAQR
ncbi:thermonuclease family protein [Luteimonas sp. MHLX1A]|uniref:thermonuclease family protein n=1 Tax=Alterluteimonas muca TaxID=2878684 RepID=UPI001E38BC14|nr:thermonuclease family protein [Luteimonas sp. MHLX1A]MCD9046751.1 thermonuclease family protein [Luteimonas sp. MHLX1A]